MKVNIKQEGKKSLFNWVKLVKDVRIAFVESDTWEQFIHVVDERFMYNNEQLAHLKAEFEKRMK